VASRDNNGLVQLSLTDLNKRITPEEFMTGRMKLDKLRDGAPFSTGGVSGYSAVADGRTPWGTRAIRYVVLFRDKRAWIFAGAAKDSAESARYDAATLETAHSFSALSPAEQELARALHLHIITAAPGTHYADLARGSRIANYPQEQLRLLNGQYPDGEPAAGQLLKIVR